MFLAVQSGVLEASAERLLDYGILGILAVGVLIAGWRLWPRLECLIDGYIENAAKIAESRIAREEEEELSEAATTKALRMALPAITAQMERIARTLDSMDKRIERLESSRAALCDPAGWCILDTETTGLGDDARVVQIGVLAPDGTVLLDTLVRPTCPRFDL